MKEVGSVGAQGSNTRPESTHSWTVEAPMRGRGLGIPYHANCRLQPGNRKPGISILMAVHGADGFT